MLIPLLFVIGIASPIGYYYYNRETYKFKENDTYDLIEINRFLNNHYVKKPVKTIVSEMHKKIEIFYRTATEEDICFLSLSINENGYLLLESGKDIILKPSYYVCEDINDLIETIDEYTEKFIEYKTKYIFNDKQKFINKINDSFRKIYAKSDNWNIVSIYKKKTDELLATITVDNSLKIIKIKRNNNGSITLPIKDKIDDVAHAVIYYISFTMANSIIE